MINSFVTPHPPIVVVIGASGFIGLHLLNVLSKRSDIKVRVLVHNSTTNNNHTNIDFIEGDLLKPDSLDGLLVNDCTVFNLAYLAQNNLEATMNLAIACSKNKVRRLIHCSTAVVSGNVKTNFVDESTPCFPVSEYEKTKFSIEKILLEESIGKFELAILRPTAVFGVGGKNLLKLANALMTKSYFFNYLRSCLFNRRSLNLVCVENVVAALIFLFDAERIGNEVFIISDDNSSANNYRDVENMLLASFCKSYLFPKIYVPETILVALLYLSGKSNSNPSKKFSDKKLVTLGFKKPQNFEAGINAFAVWYINSCAK